MCKKGEGSEIARTDLSVSVAMTCQVPRSSRSLLPKF